MQPWYRPAGPGASRFARAADVAQRTQRGVSGGSHHSPLWALTAPMTCRTKAQTSARANVRNPTSTSISGSETTGRCP